ncbi:HGxxPAAW family protein [Mobilicoccus massiliensis]|uniref:HGxxPAAW family protein n=1 Tax=Mobilicoccus massiliensis TaxID=1522310 RepID=UPI0006934803|nr:HGxxPAAW family protein [Mobilicoccus massiliensis]
MSESHGNSVAAWTGVVVILVGTALICFGLMFAMPVLWITGIVAVLAGVAAWVGLSKAGYGAPGHGPTHGVTTNTTAEHSGDHARRRTEATATDARSNARSTGGSHTPSH